MRTLLLLIALPVVLASCLENPASRTGDPGMFDTGQYFGKEAARLALAGSSSIKYASRNGIHETKQVDRPDWSREFAMFSQSNINKAAFKGRYRLQSNGRTRSWLAMDPDLRTRMIRVTTAGNKISRIDIYTSSDNTLYSSTATLTYFPDSLYLIRKSQKIRFLAADHYLVTGKIKN